MFGASQEYVCFLPILLVFVKSVMNTRTTTEQALYRLLRLFQKYAVRSGNDQILHPLRQCIRDFESENGKIPFDSDGKESQN